MSFTITWISLEDMRVSTINQAQKDSMISLKYSHEWGLGRVERMGEMLVKGCSILIGRNISKGSMAKEHSNYVTSI